MPQVPGRGAVRRAAEEAEGDAETTKSPRNKGSSRDGRNNSNREGRPSTMKETRPRMRSPRPSRDHCGGHENRVLTAPWSEKEGRPHRAVPLGQPLRTDSGQQGEMEGTAGAGPVQEQREGVREEKGTRDAPGEETGQHGSGCTGGRSEDRVSNLPWSSLQLCTQTLHWGPGL